MPYTTNIHILPKSRPHSINFIVYPLTFLLKSSKISQFKTVENQDISQEVEEKTSQIHDGERTP